MSTVQQVTYGVVFGEYAAFVVLFTSLAGAHLWRTTIRPWRRRLRRAKAYQGRHRPDGTRPPQVHWMDNYRGRIQHHMAVQSRTVSVASLEDTGEMLLPDFDSDVDDYHHELAPGRMLVLREDNLDASAARAQKILLLRSEILSPARLPLRLVEYDDARYAEVMAG